MADEDTPTEDTGTDPPADDTVTRSQVETLIASAIAGLSGKRTTGTRTKDVNPDDVAAQVREQLEAMRKAEASEQEQQSLLTRLGQLEEAAKAGAEKPPHKFRRVERIMGWSTDDDR